MGLDMYLKGKRYVSKMSYELDVPLTTPEHDRLAALYPELDNDMIYGYEVSRVIAYWRKANQIHQWFVDNVQDGNDNCSEYYVSRGDLEELRDLCKQVLANKDSADDVLPTQPGFFFGDTDYNECYYGDLEYTVDVITKLLADDRLKDCDFYYQSSW